MLGRKTSPRCPGAVHACTELPGDARGVVIARAQLLAGVRVPVLASCRVRRARWVRARTHFSLSGIDRSVRSRSRAVLCEGGQLRGCRFKASEEELNPTGAGCPAPFSLLNISFEGSTIWAVPHMHSASGAARRCLSTGWSWPPVPRSSLRPHCMLPSPGVGVAKS